LTPGKKSFSFDAELEHGNPVRKGSAKQPEDGRWLNDNRFAGGEGDDSGVPHSG